MDPGEHARAAYSRAGALRETGEQRAAADMFLIAADGFEASREAELHATALVEAGRCFVAAGVASQAIAPYRQAASVIRELLPTRGPKARHDLARVLTNLGQAQGQLGQPDEALAAFEEAMRLSRDDDEHLYAWTLLSVGRLYRELKRPLEARGYLSDSYEVFTRLDDAGQAAHAANNLGAVFNDLGEHEDALAYFEKARDTYVTRADDTRVAIADANIGRQQFNLGRFNEAEQSIETALAGLTRPEDSILRATVLTTKSNLTWASGDRRQALISLQESVDIYQRHGQVSDCATVVGTLGARLIGLGRLDDGLELVERSVGALEHAHDTLRSRQLRAFYLDRVNEAYAGLVGCYVSANRPADALAAAERAKARTLALVLAGVRTEHAGEDEAELISVQRELGAVHASLRRNSPPDAIRQLERRERELQLALISLEAARGASLDQASTAGAPETTRELLLEYVLGPRESYLIATMGDSVEAFVLPASGVLEREIRALRDDLRLGLAPPHSYSLYRMLLEPAEHLLDTTDEILIIPDGVLLDLAFSVLTRADPRTGPRMRSWSDYPWLVRSHAVRYAPSARVAAALAERRAQRLGQFDGEIAAFAAPLTELGDVTELPGDATRAAARVGASLAPLRYAFDEITRVCRELGYRGEVTEPALVDAGRFAIRSHSAATKAAVTGLARTKDFRYWHFACHGVVDVELADHSGLVLSDVGDDCYWRAYEVAGVSMRCELVTLSACDTGRGRKLRGEGVLGLARAFFAAGADTVCVSMWPVVDRSAATVMGSFYSALASGQHKAQALRSAQCEAIDRDLHPRHWGAFTLVGAS